MFDALSSWFNDLRVRHAFLVVGRFRGMTGVRIPAEGAAAFHYCLRGACDVVPDGFPATHLTEGEFLFMRDGLAREVWSGSVPRRRGPATALRTLTPSIERDTASCFATGSGLTEHVILGGALCLDNPEVRPFVDALPPVLCARRGAPYLDRLRTFVEELVEEASNAAAGAGPVVARLTEVAVLIGLRASVSSSEHGCGLVDAARDPRLGRALAAIHRDPAHDWTIATLGRIAGMSRSGFAAHFAQTIGQTPAAYLAAVRIARAERLLSEQDWSLPRIAEEVGYASPAAFSVAFKRIKGVPPSVTRRAHR